MESCLTLDVNDLSARGYLQPGWLGAYQWTDGTGNAVFSISLRCEGHQLHLSWRSCIGSGHIGNSDRNDERDGGQEGGRDGARDEVTETIQIVRMPWRFGGSLPYFLCPGGGAVAGCGRRVSKLYFSRGRFLCRHCSRLTYASQYEQRWQRALRRANKLQQRLALAGIWATAPEKPEGMRMAAYAQLLEAVLQAEMRATEAGTARLLQPATRIGSRRKPPQFTL